MKERNGSDTESNHSSKIKKRKKWKIILPISFAVGLLALVMAFLLFHVSAVHVDSYFEDSETVRVEIGDNYYFFDSPSTDRVLLYYPGAKIDEKSYAPILRMVAESGYDVYCFHMPFYLAVLDINRADTILCNSSYTQIFIGGHSLGGAMAARYIANSKFDICGLVLFGAYSDLSLLEKENLSVFSTYGTRDEILNMRQYERFRENLPEDRLTEVVVEGGNHSRCASYGDVLENPEGAISKEEQCEIMSSSLIQWMDSLSLKDF